MALTWRVTMPSAISGECVAMSRPGAMRMVDEGVRIRLKRGDSSEGVLIRADAVEA